MKYNRVLIKLSGQALSGEKGQGFCMETVNKVCSQIKQVADRGIQVAIVVGAGNIWRGRLTNEMHPVSADNMGMLATTINAIMIEDTLNRMGAPAIVMSAVEMSRFAKIYKTSEALEMLDNKKIVIFAAGTGNPFFTTDTAASLRALEINCDIILGARNVDGVYDSDPAKNADAKKYKTINYNDVIKNELKAVSYTHLTLPTTPYV
jgi:uridylate kinase